MEHKKTFHQMMDDSQKALYVLLDKYGKTIYEMYCAQKKWGGQHYDWHIRTMQEFRSHHKDLDLVQCYKLVSMAVKKYKK